MVLVVWSPARPVEAEAPELVCVDVERRGDGVLGDDASLVRAAGDRPQRAPARRDRRRRGAEDEASRVPAARLPERPDGVDASASEADRRSLRLELRVVEIPRLLVARAAAPEARPPE